MRRWSIAPFVGRTPELYEAAHTASLWQGRLLGPQTLAGEEESSCACRLGGKNSPCPSCNQRKSLLPYWKHHDDELLTPCHWQRNPMVGNHNRVPCTPLGTSRICAISPLSHSLRRLACRLWGGGLFGCPSLSSSSCFLCLVTNWYLAALH